MEFNKQHFERTGRTLDPTFKYIESTVKNNMDLIRTRIHKSGRYVRPDHLLYKIITLLAINTSLPKTVILNAASDAMYGIASSLGLTSAVSIGRIHNKVLMDGCSEIVFIHNDEFEEKPWHQLEPIQFKYHCETNMNGLRGGLQNTETVAIISINIPMLVWMYCGWVSAVKRVGATENTYNFIAKYVLCNSLYSYFNISYFNRIYYRLKGIPFDVDKKNGELSLVSYEQWADKADLHLIEHLSNGRRTIEDVLWQTQFPFVNSGLDLLETPVVAKTKQILWILAVYQLPFIHYGLLGCQLGGHLGNTGALSTLKRQLGQQLDVSIIRKNDTPFTKYLVSQWLEPIKLIIE